MRNFYFLLFLALAPTLVYSESEPNNTKAQANSLAANGSQSGTLRPNDVDWYRIQLTADGNLKIRLTPGVKKIAWMTLFDNDGTTALTGTGYDTAYSITGFGLAAGTFYLQVSLYNTGDSIPYTLQTTLTQPIYATDKETNGDAAHSIAFGINSSMTGHAGYYNNLQRDSSDYYKITTAADGKLSFEMIGDTHAVLVAELLDSNGTTLLAYGANADTVRFSMDGLRTGSYYLRVSCYYKSDYNSYRVKSTFTKAPFTADAESNDDPLFARVIGVNATTTGHVGYYYNLRRDSSDWYKINLPDDGDLKVKVKLTNGQTVAASIIDKDGKTVIAFNSANTDFVVERAGLAAGTFYVQVRPFYQGGFAPYILTDSLTKPGPAKDIEPNNTKSTATNLTINAPSTEGHVGYYYNLRSDTADWYAIALPNDGKLSFTFFPTNHLTLFAELIDVNGSKVIINAYGATDSFKLEQDGLAKGNYFLRLICFYSQDHIAYRFSNQFTKAAFDEDTEPNSKPTQPQVLPVNSTTTGHVNYYYNLKRDTADWYKIVTPQDGKLILQVGLVNNRTVVANLYDADHTALITSGYSDHSFTIVQDGLGAGTYYLRISTYYSNDFAPYSLTDSLAVPIQANDNEANNSAATASTLPLDNTTTGHVGYYYNLKRDSSDWYKVTLPSDGRLNLKLKLTNSQLIQLQLIDSDGSTVINGAYDNQTYLISSDGLAAGVYFLKITPIYNGGFGPYELIDSFISVTEVNDPEPNNRKAIAATLSPDTKTTGHIGYYSSGKRDTQDWYKLTTTGDGAIKLKLSVASNQLMVFTLFDNDGTTALNSGSTTDNIVLMTDCRAAGTYFIRVNPYYSNGFAPYTLTDSVFLYSTPNDGPANEFASQATAMAKNAKVKGHVGFYYNNNRDEKDWWKVNVTTSSKNLKLIFKQEARKWDGHYPTTEMLVYRDTAGGAIAGSYYSGNTAYVTLATPAVGTYYIRLQAAYNGDCSAYTLTDSIVDPSFTGRDAIVLKGSPVLTYSPGELVLYPNPASTSVRLTGINRFGTYNIAISDARGRVVRQKTLTGTTRELTVAGLTPGIYAVRVSSSDGQRWVNSLVVVR